MKKNVKNKILAFSMASAMIVPNVAVVFAEAPKAGLATVAKEASETKIISVSYLEGAEWKASEQVKVPVDATSINTSLLKNVPAGYETCETGDLPLNESDCININIRKKTTKKIFVSYIDEKTNMSFENGIETIEVPVDATTFSTSLLKNVPEGYELCETGDVYFGDNDTLNVKVRKKAEEKKTINVTYYYVDEKGENISCGTDSIKLDASATTFNTSALKNVPEGYELCETGDHYFGENDTINIEVRKKAAQTRTVYVHYIDAETKIPFENAIEKIEIPADEIHVNTKDLKEIPAGYEPVVTGDLDFYNTDDVNVELRKIEKVTTLHVNFETVDGTVVGEKTFEKTSTDEENVVFALGDDIVLPEGYHWVDYNDQIKNVTLPAGATGGHCMFVEQDETKAVLTVTFETKDGETVGTTSVAKEFTVDENGDKVTTFVLGKDFTLPEGYHLADGVDQVTEITMPGTVGGHTVIVEKDAVAPTPTEDPKKDDTKKDDTKKEETKKPSKTADTADTSDVAAYAIPLVMSMVAISAIVVGRKKLS